jgi:hypothetical protein
MLTHITSHFRAKHGLHGMRAIVNESLMRTGHAPIDWAAEARRHTPAPMADRARYARDTLARLEGQTRKPAPTRQAPTMEDNWREAGRRLTGAKWRQWDRINQRLGDGFVAMMLDRTDKAFIRACMLDGGQSLLDAERR